MRKQMTFSMAIVVDRVSSIFRFLPQKKTWDYNGNWMCDKTVSLRSPCANFQAFWRPTCRNKRPIIWQLWSNRTKFSNFYQTSFLLQRTISKNYWAATSNIGFSKKFSGGLSKQHSTCPEEHFDIQFFEFFRKLNGKFSDFELKIFDRVAKLHSTCPEDHFGEIFRKEIGDL